jgi:hypothetical protein
MEYLATHREGAGGKFVYELMYDGACDAKPHLSGLIDIAAITSMTTTTKSRGGDSEVAPRSRGDNGAIAGRSRNDEKPETPALVRRFEHLPSEDTKTHVPTSNGKTSSYPQAVPAFPLAAAAHGD